VIGELYWLRRPYAHRGLHDAAKGIIENSASAIRAAMGKGYAIEVDLCAAAEHMPVVFHDATLDRLTGEKGPIAARDAESLSAIPLRGSNDTILSFAELLETVEGRVPLLLEVKSNWSRDGKFETNIAAALKSYPGPVAVMSFDPYSVAAFREFAPALPRGLVAGRFDKEHDWPHCTPWQRFAMRHLLTSAFAWPHFIAYDIAALPTTAPLATRFVFGLPLLTWTVRTKEERERAQTYADAMIFEGIVP
jgi:glycerophosphoryl diester phosphodiesterase